MKCQICGNTSKTSSETVMMKRTNEELAKVLYVKEDFVPEWEEIPSHMRFKRVYSIPHCEECPKIPNQDDPYLGYIGTLNGDCFAEGAE